MHSILFLRYLSLQKLIIYLNCPPLGLTQFRSRIGLSSIAARTTSGDIEAVAFSKSAFDASILRWDLEQTFSCKTFHNRSGLPEDQFSVAIKPGTFSSNHCCVVFALRAGADSCFVSHHTFYYSGALPLFLKRRFSNLLLMSSPPVHKNVAEWPSHMIHPTKPSMKQGGVFLSSSEFFH